MTKIPGLFPLICFLGRQKTALLRYFVPGFRRQRGIEQETCHWDRLFSSRQQLLSNEEFRRRAEPGRPLQPEIAALLPPGTPNPAVLDVGCGPLSTIGVTFSSGRVDLHGADPLASRYEEMLKRIGVPPNCTLHNVEGENLAEFFRDQRFDVVTSINALDHAESPVLVFQQMLAVSKPGGFIYLFHAENEGIHERYRGMHQWNLRMEGGRPVANDGRRSFQFLGEGIPARLHGYRRIEGGSRPSLEWIFRKEPC